MKSALHYTLRRYWGNYSLMVVTSEKNSQVYGRNEHDEPTHARTGDVSGRFPTREAALGLRTQLIDHKASWNRRREPIEKQLSQMHAQERLESDDIIRAAGGKP
jgi:hypothetical protein